MESGNSGCDKKYVVELLIVNEVIHEVILYVRNW